MFLNNQQLTFYPNKETNQLLKKVLHEASLVFEELFTHEETAALILIGGYGRGEGGIVARGDTYHPHNNLDLLYIHHDKINSGNVASANKRLQEISKKYDIGIDMSAINKEKLLSLDGLVIGYDMRYGHKTLLGDSSFLRENKKFSVYSIDPADMRQLLVNRGTLLLINRLLLQKETLSIEERKLIIKHSVKAIIGYGDALLYFHSDYHWSYAQKQTNMSKSKTISEDVKVLYQEAMLFRLMPDYDTYLQKDLKSWNDTLIQAFQYIHMECEKIHMQDSHLTWDSYLEVSLESKSYPRQNVRQKVKSSVYGVKHASILKELNSLSSRMSFMQVGGKGMLSLLFPYIMYEIEPTEYKNIFKTVLHTKQTDKEALLKSFLIQWSKWGDTNFINVLRTYNISLEG